MESFDAIIDLYLVSTSAEKLEFMGTLDNYEFELFFMYLRDTYPTELDAIP